MAAVSKQRVRDALLPVVSGAGYDLEDVSVSAAGRRSVVRVVVDRDGGVDLDAVAEISRLVSDALDSDEVTGSTPFTLEVTSPGVDRPLTEPRHWRRNIGRLVQASVSGEGSVTGRVLSADETAVTLDVDGSERVIDFADLGQGKVQVEFNRAESGS
jgi:ribosome maturation factor RimP